MTVKIKYQKVAKKLNITESIHSEIKYFSSILGAKVVYGVKTVSLHYEYRRIFL